MIPNIMCALSSPVEHEYNHNSLPVFALEHLVRRNSIPLRNRLIVTAEGSGKGWNLYKMFEALNKCLFDEMRGNVWASLSVWSLDLLKAVS